MFNMLKQNIIPQFNRLIQTTKIVKKTVKNQYIMKLDNKRNKLKNNQTFQKIKQVHHK